MSTYYTVPGVDTGVCCTANSADVRGNVHLRLAVGGEAGIVIEEDDPADVAPRFVAIYFPADNLDVLINHLRAMQAEYRSERDSE